MKAHLWLASALWALALGYYFLAWLSFCMWTCIAVGLIGRRDD